MVRKVACVCLWLVFSMSTAISQAGLVAHYTFDDGDVDGNVIKDVSGNALNGIKVNDGPVTGVPGKIGQAALFDGGSNNEDNHYVDLSDHAERFGELGEGTLAAWLKPVTADEAGNTTNCRQDDVCHFTDVLTIFAASDSTQGSAEMRWVVHTATSPFNPVGPGGAENGSQYLGIRGADFSNHLISDVADDVNLLDGEWHHVAVSVNGDNVGTMFIDGVEVESFYQSGEEIISFMGDILPDGPDTVGIGRNQDSTPGGGQWFYHGLIDDLRVYDEALQAADVRSLFDLGTTDPCDYNSDGVLDIRDLDLLVAEVKAGTGSAKFDVNSDGVVNSADIVQFVETPGKLNTWVGDSNLDGRFDSGDLVALFQAGEFEDGVAMNSTWSTGDFNGDGEFGTGDLVAAFQGGGFEQGPRGAVAAVPEPSCWLLFTIGLFSLRRRVWSDERPSRHQ